MSLGFVLSVASFVLLVVGSSMAIFGNTFSSEKRRWRLTYLGWIAAICAVVGVVLGGIDKWVSYWETKQATDTIQGLRTSIALSNEKAGTLLTQNKKLFAAIEEMEEHRYWEARHDIRWAIDHPEAQGRLLRALANGKDLFWAIHIAQETNKKHDVRDRLDAYGPQYAEPYARWYAKEKVKGGAKQLETVVKARGRAQQRHPAYS